MSDTIEADVDLRKPSGPDLERIREDVTSLANAAAEAVKAAIREDREKSEATVTVDAGTGAVAVNAYSLFAILIASEMLIPDWVENDDPRAWSVSKTEEEA